MSTHAHHKLIHGLVSEVKRLRRELRDAAAMAEDYSESAHRAEQRAEKARREARYQVDEAHRAQRELAEDYQDALKALEKARDRGEDWEEERALKRLKNL